MKIKPLLYSSFLSFVALQGFAQKSKTASADKKYESYAYIDAIANYESIAEKGYQNESMFQKLGNAYYFNADFSKAAKWYAALFVMNKEQEPEYCYRYAQTLKSIGEYGKADTILLQYNQKASNDQRAKLFKNHVNYLEEIKENSDRFIITDAGVNSEFSDYGTSFYDNKLVFTSARDNDGIYKKPSKWTNQSYTNLYSSEVNANGDMITPTRFIKSINSKFHESTAVFTKDGKTMYFTRNNFLNGKKGISKDQIILLKLYKATLVEGQWSNIVELPFNNDQYNVAHPALSASEQTLYFASDMPGTLGQSDLYKVAINPDGTYSKPENLGTTINTEGKETFPFVSDENELYFASDGRPGLGGLDVFVTKIESKNGFKEIQNIGAPVNSTQDDFAFLMDSKTRQGFFSSNRAGGKGYDDIYKFTETRKLICEQLLTGTIFTADNKTPIANAKVTQFDEKGHLLQTVFTNENGQYRFEVTCGKAYSIRAETKLYETKEAKITIGKISGESKLDIVLEKTIIPITVGTDLAKVLNIPIIYFDVNKYNIRPDAAFELEKIIAVLRQYPTMKIEVRSHTDSRGSDQKNLVLSDNRAKSTAAWIVKEGIEITRVKGKGFGEKKLINKCANNIKCTLTEHQVNRRSEFIVVSM
jgi:outer membrane protein OmpA-like peptidoglycan-associated protein/tetratricopeptide (TPR) repeat protein